MSYHDDFGGYDENKARAMKSRANPEGIEFYDRATNRKMKLVTSGTWKDWLIYKHPDGQWVSLREATEADKIKVREAAAANAAAFPGPIRLSIIRKGTT